MIRRRNNDGCTARVTGSQPADFVHGSQVDAVGDYGGILAKAVRAVSADDVEKQYPVAEQHPSKTGRCGEPGTAVIVLVRRARLEIEPQARREEKIFA